VVAKVLAENRPLLREKIRVGLERKGQVLQGLRKITEAKIGMI
jgi:hypothetical protein